MCDCRCYIGCDDGDGYCVGLRNTERSTLDLLNVMIVDSRDCDLKDVTSRSVVTEII